MSMLVELVLRSIHESSKILLGGNVSVQSYLKPMDRETLISSIPKEEQKALHFFIRSKVWSNLIGKQQV